MRIHDRSPWPAASTCPPPPLWYAIHLPVDCTRRSIIENDPTSGPSAINEFIKIMAHLRASNTPVTLANWRQQPFNQWGFRNVRELLPTANIARSDTPTILPLARRHLEAIAFDDRKSEKQRSQMHCAQATPMASWSCIAARSFRNGTRMVSRPARSI
jgi:hypothetical protein